MLGKIYRMHILILIITSLILFGCKKSDSPSEPEPEVTSIGELTIDPGEIFVNTATTVRVQLVVPPNVSLVDSGAQLAKVDANGEIVAQLGYLYDNGDLFNGDEIIGDNIYSGILYLTESEAGDLNLKAFAKASVNESEFDGSSENKVLTVYTQLTTEEFDEIISTQENSVTKLEDYLQGSSDNIANAVTQLKTWLQQQPEVQSIESEGSTSILIQYKSGLHGGIIMSLEDESGSVVTRGGIALDTNRRNSRSIPPQYQSRGKNYKYPQGGLSKTVDYSELDPKVIGNRNVMIFAPFEAAFAPYNERASIINILNKTDFKFEITSYVNQEATVGVLSNMTSYGLVVLATHGSQGKSFATGEVVDTNNAAYKNSYKALLKSGKLAIWKNMVIKKDGTTKTKADIYAVRASYISGLSGKFPNSVILNNSCESTMNADLSNAFTGKGAKTYYGYSKVVNSGFCVAMADTVIRRLAEDLKTTGESFMAGSDPVAPNAVFQMKGANDVHYSDELINGDFEFGKLDGWTKAGDGRVISKLVTQSPAGGSYMGIISTGLGYTTATGSIFQTFTIDENQSTLTVKWNFLSEEFLEYIGSSYQDYWRISIKTKDQANATDLLYKSIDGIASEFGAYYVNEEDFSAGNLISVSPAISFDRGGVYMTGWQTSTFDVSAYKGKRVTLTLAAGDVGDSIFDTAILIDDVSIK